MTVMDVTRRAFLKISLAVSGVMASIGIFKFLSFDDGPKIATRATLKDPDLYPPGSVIPVPEVQAWLLRDQDGLYAISSVCTHLGCIVKNTGDQFECPCHGSKFNLDGRVLNGPAISSLKHVELTRSPENLLVINTTVIVPSTQRLV